MKLTESTVPCPACGELMSCLLTGPPSQPHTRATYVCRNNDYLGVCQGAGWLARHPLGLDEHPAKAPTPCAACNPAFSHGAWLQRHGGKCEACDAEFEAPSGGER